MFHCWLKIAICSLIPITLLSACLIVPTNYSTWHSRTNVAKSTEHDIVVGETTRQQIFFIYGEPDFSNGNDTHIEYHWAKVVALLLMGKDAAEIVTHFKLVIKIDEHGVVSDRFYENVTAQPG